VHDVPYHRLRLFFGLESPLHEDPEDPTSPVIASDVEVMEERTRINSLSADQQPPACAQAFRKFAALDGIDLKPAQVPADQTLSLFPAIIPAPLVLANLNKLMLTRTDSGWSLSVAVDGGVDSSVRPTHVATSTVQELLCGPPRESNGGDPGPSSLNLEMTGAAERVTDASMDAFPDAFPDAGGPRVDPDSVQFEIDKKSQRIMFQVNTNLISESVSKRAIRVTVFDESAGWRDVDIEQVSFNRSKRRVLIRLGQEPEGQLIRLMVRGTGPAPLMDSNLIPLAGALNDPPAGPHNGRDFILMHKRN
jgi:hypothetical protein